MPFVLQMVAASASLPTDTARAQNALALFLLLVAILGVVIFTVVLILAAHRARRLNRKPDEEKPLADPWKEAANRMKPHDNGGGPIEP